MGACVMRFFANLLFRFGRDERGAFAVIFALTAIVLIALSGAVVDYVSLEQVRNRAQIALDAATLALQPEIFEKPLQLSTIQDRAQALVLDRLGTDEAFTAKLTTPVADVANGTLTLEADLTVQTLFVTLVGVPELRARIRSQATRKKLALEVAFVLDNSGSMSYTGAGANGTRQRMQFLKDAANCATYTLFYDAVETKWNAPDSCVATATAKKVENVRLAVVPFTMYVNVGSGNANASWIDQTGASVIANDNFDTDDNQNTLPGSSNTPAVPNPLALFSATKENWRGCVVARPHLKTGSASSEYLDTDDSAPLGSNTLYVPHFSPDMVDGIAGNSYIEDMPATCDRPAQGSTKCSITEERSYSYWSGWTVQQINGVVDAAGPTNFSSNALYPGGYYGGHPPSCRCRSGITYTTNWDNNNRRKGTCNSYIPYGLSERVLQERVCKYYANWSGSGFSRGPNENCTRTAILPLTDSPTSVTGAINSMQAEGGTNIHEGTAWGYRALSPTLPFAEGAAYDSATSKVMIVMTDGENTAYNLPNPYYPNGGHCHTNQANLNGSCYNSAYGFPYNSQNSSTTSSSGGNIERLAPLNTSNSNLVAKMNDRTNQTCENAKKAGITIYTIGLATDKAEQSTPAVVQKMLTDCASTPEKAYFPETPGELRDVFASIANELSALRLSQ